MAKKLTPLSIENMKPGASRKEISDAGQPGLYLIVQPSGSKSWAVRYCGHDGKSKKLTIGQWPAMTLADAHAETSRVRQVHLEGGDPRAEALAKNAHKEEELFEFIAAEFIAKHINVKNKGTTIYEHTRLVKSELLPFWSGRRMEDITVRDINRLVSAKLEDGKGTTANRIQSIIQKMFRWAKRTGRIEVNIATDLEKPAEEKVRERVLSIPELRVCWLAADRMGYPFGDVVKLLIITGQRRDEIARMSWHELDMSNLAGPLFTIPPERAKNGNRHIVPLSPAAHAILKAAPVIKHDKAESDWVFTHDGRLPVRGYSKNKAKLDKFMLEIMKEEAEARGKNPANIKLQQWGLHDLRRTMGTLCVDELEFIWEHIDVVHNHAKRGMAKNYNQAKYVRQKQRVLVAWAQAVDDIVKGKQVRRRLPKAA